MKLTEQPTLPRRTLLAGAGTVGALAAGAALLAGRQADPSTPIAAAQPPAPDTETGYRLTEHVKQYYRTARV